MKLSATKVMPDSLRLDEAVEFAENQSHVALVFIARYLWLDARCSH